MSSFEKGDFYFGISDKKIHICYFEEGKNVYKENLNFEIPDSLNNDLNFKVSNLNNQILSQKKTINQFDIDNQELDFLKLNLKHGHKCRRTFLNTDGFIVGTLEYKSCVLSKGANDG